MVNVAKSHIVSLSLLVVGLAPAATWLGSPVADAFVSSDAPDRNTGDWNWLAVTWWPSMPEPWYEESYIRFDLGAIPLHSLVTSADLLLYFHDGVDTGHVLALRATGDWTESGITWNVKPGCDTTGQAAFVVDSYPRSVILHPTAIVQTWVNGTSNYGFCLRPAGSSPEYTASLRSREFYDSTQIPSLRVEYDLTGCRELAPSLRPGAAAVSPNPLVSGRATLRLELLRSRAVVLLVHDPAGRIAARRRVPASPDGIGRIDLSALRPGVYFLGVSGAETSRPIRVVVP